MFRKGSAVQDFITLLNMEPKSAGSYVASSDYPTVQFPVYSHKFTRPKVLREVSHIETNVQILLYTCWM